MTKNITEEEAKLVIEQNKSYYSPYSNKIKILYNDPIAKICRIVYLT